MTAARCSLHGDAPAAGTCARCGRFACVACLASTDTCDACRALEGARLFNLRPFALGAAGLVLASSATAVFDIWVGRSGVRMSPTLKLSVLSGACALNVGAAISVPAWFYVAMQHAAVRRAKLSVDSPALGVVTWLVPILSMVEPFTLLRQMAVHAGRPHRALIFAWQLLYIAAQVLLFASLAPSSHQTLISEISRCCWVMAGILGAATMLELKWKS